MRSGPAVILAFLGGTGAAMAQQGSADAAPVPSLGASQPIPAEPAPRSASAADAAMRPARARPLFSATRRPPVIRLAAPAPVAPIATPPPPPPPKLPPQLRLVGIVEGLAKPFAVVRGSNAERAVTLRVGDRFDDWEVDRIEAGLLLLRDGAREQEYRLFPTASDGAARAVPVPANPDDGAAPTR